MFGAVGHPTALVRKTSQADSAGRPLRRTRRRYFSNLEFFLQAVAPAGSSYEERQLHLQFLQRLEAAGKLPPGDWPKVMEDLRRAMNDGEPAGHFLGATRSARPGPSDPSRDWTRGRRTAGVCR